MMIRAAISLGLFAYSAASSDVPEATCSVPESTRGEWTREVRAQLTDLNYTVHTGYLQYAPVGTISDPDGTYGVIIATNEARFPDDDFCACLEVGAAEVSVCRSVSRHELI
jgi:hypothetical protein